MSEIYVYNNPGNIQFNSYIFAFLRSWYTHDGADDRWYKIPAYRPPNDTTNRFVCINSNIDGVSVLIIADNGLLLKSHNSKLKKQTIIEPEKMAEVEQDALDISAWEKENQQSFPYADMFDGEKIKERYRARFGTDQPVYDRIRSNSFNNVKRTISPPVRCGSCGKRRRSN